MKSLKYIPFLLSIFLIAISCTEDITDELRDELDTTYPRIVVEGSISSDTMSHLVRLARTADYFSNKKLDPITNAEVSITDDHNNIYRLTENAAVPGDYYTDANVYGIPGRTYTLNISNVDIDNDGNKETFTATSQMMPINQVDSISIKSVHKYFTDLYEIRFNAPEPAATKDFYMFRVLKNGVLLTDTITELSFTDDQFFNGIQVENQPVYSLNPDKQDEHLKINDTIVLETCAIPQGYYDFLMDVMLESYGSDPFGGQPANLRTNVMDKTKATGYFVAYDVKRNMTIVRDTIK